MESEKPRPYIPRTLANLRQWLRDTNAGRELVRDATKGLLENECRACQNLVRCPKVLVVARRLGRFAGAEVYHEPGVQVRMEELVDSCDDKAIERLTDELLLAQLSKRWKHLVSCRRDSIAFTGLSAARRIESLETSRVLRELEAEQAESNRLRSEAKKSARQIRMARLLDGGE